YEEDYSDARRIEVTVEEDQELRVPVPLRRPALLRVQPTLSSPSDTGFVKLDSRMLGPTGLNREYRVPPGRYTLRIFRDLGDDQPFLVEELELHPREKVVASFSYRRDDVIINRSPIRNP
ncbi:MAG: hypothetical protein R3234_13955, partial [Thermoanaerobaculia bacterium]|nr:hypothetical protein [Thermoanaerobaculia bacterium]